MTAIGNENWAVMVSYQYDAAGNRQWRAMYNGVITEYAPVDALNRSPWTRHMFNGTQLARFDYGFDDLNRMKYEQRNGATADGYAYDKASEVTGFNRDGALSNGVVTGGNVVSTLGYDFAGNRSQLTSNGAATAWTVNNLNEYTGVGDNPVGSDAKGNVQTYTQDNITWTYTYDAQNRLRVASGNGKTLEFWYDGRNRQICRRINGNDYQITRTVWDGWNVLEERDVNDAFRQYYLYGARTDELVLRWGVYGDHWYGYDGRGNVSHLFAYSYNGLIIESYTYNLEGAPTFSGPNNESLVENRFLFQGRDYLKEGGIYDYRNRFYHPGLGRFLQPDPIGFKGDAGNLYRYCGNDPVDRGDPTGLLDRNWNAAVRAIDQAETIPFLEAEAQSGAGTASTTGVLNARERANAQSLTTAHTSPQEGLGGFFKGLFGPKLPEGANDPAVRAEMDRAWRDSNPTAPDVKRGQPGSQKIEQGGWVRKTDHGLKVMRVPPGTRDSLPTILGTRPTDALFWFHVHPNNRREDYDPKRISPSDWSFTRNEAKVPGVIIIGPGHYIPIPYP